MHDFWRRKTVFVTGATGLVGSWLVKSLIDAEAHVVVLIRDFDPQSELIRTNLIKKVSVVQGVLEDGVSCERAISEYEVDTVFHLGAQTLVGTALRNPLLTFESNIRGTYILLEACRKAPDLIKRILIASSDKAYGSSPVLPYTEDMPLIGQHPYDVSKSCADLISLSYYHAYQMPIAVARCGNIYGGGDLNWSRLIPGTIRSLQLDQSPEIRSNGEFTRDYIYVEDVINAYMTLAENLHREDVVGTGFNFGPNRPYTVNEIVCKIQELMNKQHIPLKVLNKAVSEIKHQTLDSSKAHRLLGWEPQFSIEDSFIQTINWYLEYLSQFKEEGCCL
ncbi:MAG: GDP-mannose 4,6-dehydratase [Chlamydiae bacterium]|nr:GDP-mannose 4,6-dehydratase [Chlamydiota bacterium]